MYNRHIQAGLLKTEEIEVGYAEAPIGNMSGLWRALVMLANTLLIGGGVLISGIPSLALGPGVFTLFFLGHVLWAIHAARQKNRSLLALNAGLLLLDTYAIAIRLT